MIFWGKKKKKRWRAMKRAATHFGWQATMSLLGDAATTPMRRKFSTLLLKSGSDALGRADRMVRHELDRDPDDFEAAVLSATIAATRGHWREAARGWKSILRRHPTKINRELIEVARTAYLNSGDLISAEDLALGIEGLESVYRRWCERCDNTAKSSLAALVAASQSWPTKPLISIILVCRDSDPTSLRAAIQSILSQAYGSWELSVVLCTTDLSEVDWQTWEETRDPRVELWQADEERELPSVVAAALGQVRGEFCVLQDGRSALAPHALLCIAWEIVHNPAVDWIYSDFDHLDERGRRHDPCFVGGPDHEVNHVFLRGRAASVYRSKLLLGDSQISATLGTPDGCALVAALASRIPPSRIKYIPSILQHIRAPDANLPLAQTRRADRDVREIIRTYFAQSSDQIEVTELHAHGGCRIRFPIPDPAPLVSVIVPTRDALHLLRPCIDSLRDRTRYPAIEIIVVDNDSRDSAALRYFQLLERQFGVRIIRVPEPFNWSRLNNLAVREARGSIICLLNNDVEAISEEWLAEMVSHVLRSDVGVVGAALWHPDGRLQHGGIEFVPGTGAAGHALQGTRRTELPARARVVQSFQAVTGACLVARKDVYLAVGGMDEYALPVGYSDVDFCLKVRKRLGLRTIWTPFAELLHLESASRGRLTTRADRVRHNHARRVLQNRWHEHLVDDPHYRPVLSARKPLDDSYPGARLRLNRYLCSPATRLAFIHIPKTAGVSARRFLRQVFPSPSVLSLSAGTMLRCYEGDQAALAQVRHSLRDAIALFGHFSWGFGGILQWPCVYGAILRDPVARTISHYRHLFGGLHSPFTDTPLIGKPLELLLRKGAIPGNLMLRKILGEPPESSTWTTIDAYCPNGAGFTGFRIPDAIWRQEYDEVLDGPDVVPDHDLAKVERAMCILERDFAFVGRAEALQNQLEMLVLAMGAEQAAALERANTAPTELDLDVSVKGRAAAESYNYLDRALYERIAGLPNGYLLDTHKLRPAPELSPELAEALT